jgi:twitching motility protein PilU
MQLSLNLKSIVSQRLIPSVTGRRVAAIEVLLDTARVKDLILKGEVGLLKETMSAGRQEGMQSFDDHIHDLYRSGVIDYNNAIANADSANDLRLKIKMSEIKKDDTARDGGKGKKEEGFKLKKDFGSGLV